MFFICSIVNEHYMSISHIALIVNMVHVYSTAPANSTERSGGGDTNQPKFPIGEILKLLPHK